MPSRASIGVCAALLGLALVASACATAQPQKGALHHASKSAAPKRPVTKPEILSTTSSTAATTTTTTQATAPKGAPAAPQPPPATTTTTTTVPPPPACNWSNFSTTVATDAAQYSPGQTVYISLTFRNDGPTCTATATGYGCPEVDVKDSSGNHTWTSRAGVTTGCAATTVHTVLASNWSQSAPFDWNQVDCSSVTANECSGPQVPAGQYDVIGSDAGGSSRIPSSPPAVVTIT